jgi:hypothetical protein
MPSIDPLSLPKRDARGRLLEQPPGLQPGWGRINAAGLGLGGSARIRCGYGGCRAVPVRGSDRCQHHDRNWRRKRLKQLRTSKGSPMTPVESTRLFRANAKNLWQRAPWLAMATIWLAPRFEAAFAADCHNAGLPLAETAPSTANILRWSWRCNCLNHRDDPAWLRSVKAAHKRQAKLGLPPDGYAYQPPPDTPPTDPRIKAVTRRAAAWEPASANPVVDRATRAKQRQRRLPPPQVPANFDWRDFLDTHWASTFGPLFAARCLDPAEADGELGHALAAAWHGVLSEQAQLGDGSVGPQQRHWHALLRGLGHHVGPPAPTKPPVAARPPSPTRGPVGHPDNDAWLAGLCAKVDARPG